MNTETGDRQYVVLTAGRQSEPLTSRQLRDRVRAGKVSPTDSIRLSNSDRWYLAYQVKGLFPGWLVAEVADRLSKGESVHDLTATPCQPTGKRQTKLGPLERDSRARSQLRDSALAVGQEAETQSIWKRDISDYRLPRPVRAVVAVIIIVVIILLLLFDRDGDNPSRSIQPGITDRVTAEELWNKFSENPAAADARWGGSRVVVRGEVLWIQQYGSGYKIVLGTSGNGLVRPIYFVDCIFDGNTQSNLVTIKPGQVINVEGRVDGKLVAVQLGDCNL